MSRISTLTFGLWLAVSCIGCAQEPSDVQRPSASESTPGAVSEQYFVSLPAVTLEDVDAAIAALPQLSSFILYQSGRIHRERYANGSARNRPINVKSASKSILNALTALALERGHLDSLDDPISRHLPAYFAQIPRDDPRRQITIRHLLTMSSGLPSTSIFNYGAWVSSRDWVGYALRQEMRHPPGSRMTYSTGDTHLLAAVLTRATGMPLRDFAQRHLFDPLGVRIGGWDRDPQGIYFGGNNVALSPEALLRFGRLYLEGGSYEGRRILRAEWIAESWQTRFLNSSYNTRHDYGYLWWHTRFAGHSTWFAWGYGGQFLFVVPALDAVVVLTGDPDTRVRGNNNLVYDAMERVIVPWLAEAKRTGRMT